MKPKSLQKLITSFNGLPGIGKKQAERIAYYLVNADTFEMDDLKDAITIVQNSLSKCEECGYITEEKVCDICQSKDREMRLIVVETSLDVFKFEESQSIKPYYHVLNGLVNVKKNMSIDNLNVDKLPERAKKYREVILALSPNLEGLVTAKLIRKLLDSDIKVTELAQGIPIGAAMEYVDEITLKTAIKNRKEVE